MIDTSNDFYPEEGGLVGPRKPRRNYWGNIHENDRYQDDEKLGIIEDYDYSDFDSEDDHDSYYSEISYD